MSVVFFSPKKRLEGITFSTGDGVSRTGCTWQTECSCVFRSSQKQTNPQPRSANPETWTARPEKENEIKHQSFKSTIDDRMIAGTPQVQGSFRSVRGHRNKTQHRRKGKQTRGFIRINLPALLIAAAVNVEETDVTLHTRRLSLASVSELVLHANAREETPMPLFSERAYASAAVPLRYRYGTLLPAGVPDD